MPKITKRLVDFSLPRADGTRLYIWDSEIRGFGLLILPSGVKAYFYRYRNAGRKERRITIGKHGVWTPEQARRKADELRHAVSKGKDPLHEKREIQLAPTVTALLEAYMESERFKARADATRAIDKGRVSRHLKPLLGRMPLHGLTPGDVERALVAIRDGKTALDVKTGKHGRARVTGGEGAARMAIRLLRTTINWGIGQGLAVSNPRAHVRLGTDRTRDTILEDVSEYGRMFETLDRMEREKRVRQSVADAVRLIALTGARRGEIAGLRWGNVDLKRGLITLPREAHKTGRRTGRTRTIGLATAAQAILKRQRVGSPSDFVFAPSRGEGALALSKAWRQVRAEAKLPPGIGLHGLRHSLASHMAMGGAAAAEIMTALGHSQLSTAQRYVHWAENAHQALAERAASVPLAGLAVSMSVTASESANMQQGS